LNAQSHNQEKFKMKQYCTKGLTNYLQKAHNMQMTIKWKYLEENSCSLKRGK